MKLDWGKKTGRHAGCRAFWTTMDSSDHRCSRAPGHPGNHQCSCGAEATQSEPKESAMNDCVLVWESNHGDHMHACCMLAGHDGSHRCRCGARHAPPVVQSPSAHPLDGTDTYPATKRFAVPVAELVGPDTVVYLSGPMTGLPNYNYDYFDRVATWLRRHGVTVLSPSEVDGGQQVKETGEAPESYGYYLTRALEMQLRANVWLGLEGWSKSKGAMREFSIALDLQHRTLLLRQPGPVHGMFWIEEIS